MPPPNPRIKQACDAMKKLDIPERKVRPVLRQLRKIYGDGWHFIEDDNYKVLIEAIIDQDAEQQKKESNVCSRLMMDGAMDRGKKRALEQKAQLLLKDQEEDDTDEEDEVPLKRRFRRKRESGGCDNNTISLSLGSSKNPNIKDLRQSDVAELVSLGCCTTSKKPYEEEHKHTQLAVKDEEDKVINSEDERERDSDNKAGLTLGSTPNIEDHKLKHSQPEEEDYETTELPPLKRYVRRRANNNTSPSFNSSMSTEELPPVMSLPTVPVVAENNSVSSSLTIVNNDLFTDHKLMFSDAENCSADVLVMEKPNMYVEEQKGEANVILKDTTAMDVPPPSEKVSDMVVKAGDTDTSTGLVVAPECEISADCWRALSNKNDITLGAESIKIPWVNEINDEVPPRFHYMPRNYVVSQNADVRFTVSSIHGCFLCIGDCLASSSSSTPCSCTIAYTSEGVLRKDFLEARISEARDPRKLVFQECRECPLEKDRMEPCRGHVKREAIKECWIRCGCSMSCVNRVVQRGIHSKLEVFYTSDGRGWGLRTLERLPQGSFVCEYVGEILTVSEMCQREVSSSSPVVLDAFWGCSEGSLDDSKSLCLDGTLFGNVSRFINHKCTDPNLVEIPVHVETPDQHYYHLAFFTTRDIKAMEELTWDYGVDFEDEDGVMKPFDCVCGYRFCRNPKQSKKAKRLMNRA